MIFFTRNTNIFTRVNCKYSKTINLGPLGPHSPPSVCIPESVVHTGQTTDRQATNYQVFWRL